jgi:hypothetical protein
MGRASGIQNSFDGGELSPLLLGRQDLDKYKHGLFTCLNGFPFTQGPWTRRPGTAFLHRVKYLERATRLFPFQFSTTQTYILEFGDSYIRFYTGHGILTQASQSITSITKAVGGIVTKNAHGYVSGDRLQLSSVVGMTQLNNREVIVGNETANTFQLFEDLGAGAAVIDTTNYGTFTSGLMAKIFELSTTYTPTELPDIRITQSADTVYVTHPTHAPAILVRTSALSWSLTPLVFTDGPYDVQNITATTLTPSAATGAGVTLTASAVTGINNDAGFKSTDVGRLIRLREGTIWGYVQVTAWTSTTVVTVTVLSTLTNTNAKTAWRLGVWSATTGYPRCSAFYEDRLYFAGPTVFPQRLDGSNVSGYTNFSPSATDGTVSSANAVSATLNSDDVNAILWMSPHTNALLVGTTRGEWQVRGTTQGDAIAPTNIQFKPTTRRGSANIAPVKAGDGTLFVQRGGRKLREMAAVVDGYGYTYKTPDMTALSEHITSPTISSQLAYQEQPQAIMWAPRSDGVLLGLSYDRDAGVVAWHRHELGGVSNAAGTTIPVVESLAVVVDPTGVRDELYLIVNRYINGGTKRYIEYMSKVWQSGDAQQNAFYVDCGWTDLTPATNIISGLWFLEGQTVGVYVDGALQPNVTITNGIATLTAAGTIKTIGYFYNSDGQTMPLEGGTQDGSAQGKLKRIAKLGIWVMDTLGLKYGPSVSTLTELIVRAWGQAYGTSTPLATGIFRERFEGEHDKLGQVYWRANGPFPANVLALAPQYEVADDS